MTEGIWCAGGDLTMPGGMHFGLRMSVIRLKDGRLVLHSPIAIDDGLAEEIEELGTVAHIIAPNCFHYLHVNAAARRYPKARVYAAPGLKEKRPRLTIHETLGPAAPVHWSEEMDQLIIEGAPRMNEVVFFHRASKTLIVTDLVFNIHEAKGWVTGIVLRTARVYKRLGQSRLWRFFTKDRSAAGVKVAQMMTFDFQRVIMAHGRILEQDVKARMMGALTWMLSYRSG